MFGGREDSLAVTPSMTTGVEGDAMVLGFAMIGALIAFVPGGSFILIPMEVFLIYQIAAKYRAFEFGPFLAMASALVVISGFLKGLATFLHVLPLVGQFANSLVAFGFIFIVGLLAEQYYSGKSPSHA
jgi:hypothetical protein